MNQTTTTPAIEKLKAREMSVTLYVDMTLASIPVTVSGQYNIHSNCFYPSQVTVHVGLPEDNLSDGDDLDLETFCEKMEWNYFTTQEEIQEAVEKRDQ